MNWICTSQRERRLWRPLTTKHDALLVGGSDQAFCALVRDLVVLANQLQKLRDMLACCLGVSGPQYRLFLTIAQLHGEQGVNVNQVANHLRVTGAFVTMETPYLVSRGYVEKRAALRDSRTTCPHLLESKGVRAFFGSIADGQRYAFSRGDYGGV